MKRYSGFTLIELITVMVVLSILAAFSTQFIVTSIDSYNTNKRSNELINRGRASIEQIARYLRNAVPNSARVSSSGLCVEFIPSVGGAFYDGQVPDSENGASSISSLETSPFSLDLGSAEYVTIGALDSSEIYSSTSPSAIVSISTTTGDPIESISFTVPHRFVRNSINQRVFVGGTPKRFCVSGGNLVLYESYGLVTSGLTDADPGGSSVLVSSNVAPSGRAFSLSAGTENRGTSVDVSLIYSEQNTQVSLQQTVLVRNVP